MRRTGNRISRGSEGRLVERRYGRGGRRRERRERGGRGGGRLRENFRQNRERKSSGRMKRGGEKKSRVERGRRWLRGADGEGRRRGRRRGEASEDVEKTKKVEELKKGD